jgi:signal transduction histidine kinase
MERELPAEHLHRTVRVVVGTTVLLVVALAVALVLPGGGLLNAPWLIPAMAGAVVVALSMGALPWDRLSADQSGRLLRLWSVANVLLISAGVAVSGGGRSPVVLLYALTIVFSALTFTGAFQALFFAFSMVCYGAGVALAGWNITSSTLLTVVAGLGALALMAGHLSRELRAAITARAREAAESARRAELLQVVAEAARSMSLLDSDQVLEAVVGAAVRLGFDAANLAVYDDAGLHYRIVHGVGLPPAYTEVRHDVEVGMPGLVRERRATVVVEDYAAHPRAVPVLREAGFHAVIGTPVRVHGSLEAVLVAGSRDRRDITTEEVETFELMAAVAGRALENAHLFEDEHRAVQRLAELDRLKGDFLSTVSHELRTPLTAIEGMGLTLEQQWDVLDEPVRRELVTRLNANAMSLHRIISTLLDFSRLQAGAMELHREPVPLRAFVEDVVGRLGSILSGHRISVDVPDALRVEADPTLLERVMENLLSNAVKYTPPGTEITFGANAAPDGTAEVAVTDRGPGIPPADLRYLGDRFFRGGDVNTRKTRGTGLGLALVREILRLHGTALHVESEVGRGSRFSFRLPAVEGSTGAPSAAQRAAGGA